MRIPCGVFLALVVMTGAVRAEELGQKLARIVCVGGALYEMNLAERTVYSTVDVSGDHALDANTQLSFRHLASDGENGAYCIRKVLSPEACERGPVIKVQHALGMNGPYYRQSSC